MNSELRVVTSLPVKELWRNGQLAAERRLRSMGLQEVADLLREGPVEFVVADVGLQLRWIFAADCYEFWKTEAKHHLAAVGQQIVLDSFPDKYCYLASEWSTSPTNLPIILLERHH